MKIAFMPSTNAGIVIENADLWQIYMPESAGRMPVEVNGKSVFVGNPVVLKNSKLILRNVFVKMSIGAIPYPLRDFSPTTFTSYIDTCYVEFSNVTAMWGIGFATNYTTIKMDRVTALEFILQWAFDTDVTITNSAFMYGRGIYTEFYEAVLKDKVVFTIHNTTFYETKLDNSKRAITVYADKTAYFDLRNNYWGDTSYYIQGTSNIEVEPKLGEPTVELPPEITVELNPPYPLIGGTVELIIKPKLENAYYILYYWYGEKPLITNFTTVGILKLDIKEETTDAVILIHHKKTIIKKDITIKAINPGKTEAMIWIEPEPDEWDLIYTNNVTIKVSVYIPLSEILPYINVSLELTNTLTNEEKIYPMRKLCEGEYALTITLDDGKYSGEVLVNYPGTTLAREEIWFGIEAKPPEINASCIRISEDEIIINATAIDMVTGVKRITIYYDKEKLYEENIGGINIYTTVYVAKIEGVGKITIEAEDMAGHIGNVTLEIPTEISPPPPWMVETETTTTTIPSEENTTTTVIEETSYSLSTTEATISTQETSSPAASLTKTTTPELLTETTTLGITKTTRQPPLSLDPITITLIAVIVASIGAITVFVKKR
ncbi:MAG: hypothetical protein DRO14_02070 [Thermoprotei archaeon]|nr:MAG: hypothetical protein DRO14_02070 [Thermoprotei archaeon]